MQKNMLKKFLYIFTVISVLLTTYAYSALSTSFSIITSVKIRPYAEIRVVDIKNKSTTGGQISYEPDYTKDSVITGFELDAPENSFSYDVTVRNFGEIDYIIYSSNISSTNNPDITYSTSYIEDGKTKTNLSEHIIGQGESFTFTVTYTGETGPSNIITNFVFKKIYRIYFDLQGGALPSDVDNPLSNIYKIEDVDLVLPTVSPVKQGFHFDGWTISSSNPDDKIYSPGSSFDINPVGTTYTLFAHYTLNSHQVIYNTTENGGTGLINNKTFNYGETVDLTPQGNKIGMSFVGWNTVSDATEGLTTLTMGDHDITLYAIYKKDAVTLTARWDVNGTPPTSCTIPEVYNKQIQPTSCTVTPPTVTPPANTPTFVGWNTGDVTSESTSDYNKTTNKLTLTTETENQLWHPITTKEEVTLTAKWNANNATISSTSDITCKLAATFNGEEQATSCTVTPPTITPQTGYSVVGWNTSGSATTNNSNYNKTTNKLTLTASNNNTTWYAITSANTYNIIYDLAGGTSGSLHPSEGTYDNVLHISNSSKTVTVTLDPNGTGAEVGDPTSSTQTFAGWSSTNVGSNAKSGTTSNPNKNWDGSTTTDTYFKNLVSDGTVTMVANWTSVPVSLPSIHKIGYNCKVYTEKIGGTEVTGSYSPASNSSSNVTLYVRCTEKQYTLTINPNSGKYNNSTSNSTKTMTYNSSDNNSIGTPNELDGYTFVGWNTKQNGSGVPLFDADGNNYSSSDYWSSAYPSGVWKYDGDVTVYAQYIPNNDTPYKVYHYIKDIGANTYSLHSTQNLEGTTNDTLTLSDLKETITGFTYSGGVVNGVTVTETTIAPDGSREIHLYYTRNTYTVTLNKETGINKVSGAGTYEYGASVSIGATLNSGYNFKNWTVGTGTTVFGTENPKTITIGTSDVTYKANGELITYTINYNLNGGTVSSSNPTTYNVTTNTFTLNNPTKTGYTFTGWTGSNGNTPSTSVSIAKGSTGNKNYTANFAAKQTTLTLDATTNGGSYSGTITDPLTYDSTTNNSIGTATKDGYTFAGWFTESTGGVMIYDSNGENVQADGYWSASYPSGVWKSEQTSIKLYAQFTTNDYKVVFNSNAPTGETVTGSMDPQSMTYGETTTLTPNKFSISGYTFAGWNTEANGSGTDYVDKASVSNLATSGNFNLYAQWIINTVTIGLVKDGSAWSNSGMKVTLYKGTNPTSFTTTVSSGSVATFTKVPADTYNIYIGKDSNHKTDMVDSGEILIVENESTNKAVNYYSLSVGLSNATVSVNGTNINNTGTVVVAKNASHSIVATANPGYEFVSNSTIWTNTGTMSIGDTKSSSTTITVSSSGTLTSTSSAKIYSISLDNQGATTSGTGTVYYQYNTSKVVNNVTCYYYTNSSLSTCLSNGKNIVSPSKTGYSYYGYYTATSGSGTKYIDVSGEIINDLYKKRPEEINSNYINQITLYANYIDDIRPTKPTVSLSYVDGSGTYVSNTWTNKKVKTVVSTIEEGSGVTYIQYNYSGNWENGTSVTQSGSTFTKTEEWDLIDGRNISIKFKAIDSNNNESSESDQVKIRYDITAPTISTSSVNDTIIYGNDLDFTINDSLSGVVAWQINQSNVEPTSGWNSITNTSSFSDQISDLDVGTYYVWAKDEAGNISFKEVTVSPASPIIILDASLGSAYVGNTTTFNAKANVEGTFSVESNNTTYSTVELANTGDVAANTNDLVTVTAESSDGTSSANSIITITFTPKSSNYSQAITIYNMVSLPYTSTVVFSPNTSNNASTDNVLSTPTGCTRDISTGEVTCSCTTSNSSNTCSITSPTISNDTTTSVIGFSTSSTDGSETNKWNTSSEKTFSNGANGTYYAQTKKDSVDGSVTFNLNGNNKFTYNNTNYTSTTTVKICTIEATYNGVAQSDTCINTVTMPEITANSNTPTLIGWSTSATDRTALYTSGETGVILTSGSTYYAQTKKDAVTLKAKWNGNGATLSSTTTLSCTLSATYNGTAQDTSCTVTAPTVSSYPSNTPTFVGFNTSNSSTTNNSSYNKSTNKLTLTSSNDNNTWYVITTKTKVTLTAKWNKNDASSLSSTTNSTCDLAATFNGTAQDTSCTVTAPTITAPTGYSAKGFNSSSSATSSSSSYNSSTNKLTLTSSNNNTTWYAIIAANKYTIAYDLAGGTHGNLHPTSGTYDVRIDLNNPSRTGYNFKGWKSSSSDGLSTSTAKTSSDGTTFSSWSGSATNNSYFKNLRTASGTVTLTATWQEKTPTAPVITGGTGNTWIDHNQLIWVQTDGSASSGIDRYEYCINTSNSTSGCTWTTLYPAVDPSYHDISDYFDPAVYHQENTDLQSAFSGDVSELVNHFKTGGNTQLRTSSQILSLSVYKTKNSDLSSAYGTNYANYYTHFANNGINETSRSGKTSNWVNVNSYKSNYSDLSNAFGSQLVLYYRHMMSNGIKENRNLYGASKYVRKAQEINEHGLRYIFFRTVSKDGHYSAASNVQITRIGVKSADPVCGTTSSPNTCTASCCGSETYYYWSTCTQVGESAEWCSRKGGSMNCSSGSNCVCRYACQKSGSRYKTCSDSACCGNTQSLITCWHE